MIGPQVAFSKDFMVAYSRLPKKQQKKVREFTEKFQQDPTQSGINFERLEGAVDNKVRSVRIDQAYRAIIIHPPRGDVYLCVWVDHHDEAYRWVKNKRFEVNPTLGSFQLFELVEGTKPAEAPDIVSKAALQPATVFGCFDEEELILAGVPVPLLAAVRSVKSDDELDRLTPYLPEDAADMLCLLAAGYSVLEAIEGSDPALGKNRGRSKPKAVDTEDFATALATSQGRRVFKIAENERELEAMLDAPLDQWRIFLHPSQRQLVTMKAAGPVRVLGSAGTGKTVVLMHRAKHLADEVFADKDDQILVTSYSRNLAADLRANLQHLCGRNSFARFEVANLHRWARQFMKKHGHTFRPVSGVTRRSMLETATSQADGGDYAAAFYREEWERIVQPQEVSTLDEYLVARRVGRGTRLGRKERARVWSVMQRYRELLDSEGLSDWQDLIRETRLFIEKQRISLPYRAVLADEAQDFTPSGLGLLRTLAPEGDDTLFIVGDAHQRIWGQPTRLSSCGVKLDGEVHRLTLNYRTTERIRDRAVAVLDQSVVDDLDGGADSFKGYRSLRRGTAPAVQVFDSEADEAKAVVGKLKEWLQAGVPAEAISVAARTNDLLDQRYRTILEGAGIDVVTVDSNSDSKLGSGVRLSTMHRMKGLEFSRVLLAGVQDGQVPLRRSNLPDAASEEDHLLQEKCLLYVALTRARDEVVVMGFGKASPLLKDG